MTLFPEGDLGSTAGSRAHSGDGELGELLKECYLGDEAAFAKLNDATST